MLKLMPDASLTGNRFIRLANNTYQLPNNYHGLTGKLDLSSYDDLTIIVPETYRYFATMCLICSTTSPSKSYQPKHKIVFNHSTFDNVIFSLFCFDGISTFECHNSLQLPKTVSSCPFTISDSLKQNSYDEEIQDFATKTTSEIYNRLDCIKMLIKSNMDGNEKMPKYKMFQLNEILNKLDEITILIC